MRQRTDPVALNDARERVIARLSEAFARDIVGVDELDGRLTLAHRAETVADVERIVADLRIDHGTSEAIPNDTHGIAAILGGVERGGRWTVPRHLRVRAVLGGALLDLREAQFLPGVTEIHVAAVLGGILLIVAPTLAVEVSGSAVLGGFAHPDRVAVRRDREQPVLRVHGRAILGGVAVESRFSGESEADAQRRRRCELPALGRSG